MVWCRSVPNALHPPLLRILLPLLLCLSLIASAVGSVWAATAMAMPAPVVTSSAGQHTCHDAVPGMHDSGSEHADHAAPMALCGDGKHCDCTQHCNVLPPAILPLLADIPRTHAPLPAEAGVASIAPGRLIRPPIA